MSGCCGQGPVIISGTPAATSRLDVATVLLCDVLPDGTVAGVALVEPVYDATSGDRLATRIVDPVTGDAYVPVGTLGPCAPDGCNATTAAQVLCDVQADGTAVQFTRATTYDCQGALLATLDRTLDGAAYTVTGTVQVCPTAPDCEQPTTPTATVGLCLPDGTPIAVTVVRDCEGVTTQEGWVNLRTGAFSAGAPPAGTIACGEGQSVQVSGTFCDLAPDGTVLGLVLIEYSYAADGTISGVRLVDATTGSTYTPQGTISVCPAGVEQPEQDLAVLCDTAPDGTVTPYIRDYRRDELGAITGHSDYTLDGAAYTPSGTVGNCQAEPCHGCETLTLCDLVPESPSDPVDPPFVTPVPFLRTICRDCSGAVTSTTDTALDGTTPYVPTGEVTACDAEPAATPEQPESDAVVLCDTAADGTVTAFVRDYWRDVSGQINGYTDYALDGALYTPAGIVGTCTPQATPAEADVETIPLCLIDDATGNVLQNIRAEVVYDATGARTETRYVDAVTGAPATPPAGASFAVCPAPDGCAKQVIERCGCDDADGDGIGEVTYTELWAVDPCGGDAPALLGTYRDGDLTQPYTPVAPGECTASLEEPEPLFTGIRRTSGDEVVNLSGIHPGLQSATLTVLAGQGTVTTDDGTATIPAGVTLSWSVSQDTDQALTTWTGGSVGTGSDVLLHFTYRG
ncbi:hypothetical protein [Streptomyces sp. OE57]|uniref:hypothetical protein n=1 Tax=Streptomyces lacaronensis TaxID=3379885 RepID=UPI0039B72330